MDLNNFLQNLPNLPGVYSMHDQHNQVIYIGKAKNLKNRIKSYFNSNYKNFNPKTNALVNEIANIEITVTKNEIEALLLENKLINQFKPKYNVIFRDDKSYPYILITNEEFPSIRYWRGKLGKNYGTLYGPYPNNKAVRVSLDLLAKIFKLRNCDLITFKNRTRPCLEYQLNRCSAPCVGFIGQNSYNQEIAKVKLFLQGKSKILIKDLKNEMGQAALSMNYELAAKLRDQINALVTLQNEQSVMNKKSLDVDVIGIAVSPKMICIHVLRIRQGDLLYSKQFFSKNTILATNDYDKNQSEEFLKKFIIDNYLNSNINCNERSVVSEILTNLEIQDVKLITKLVKIKISCAKNGDKLAWQQMAQNSAEESLISRVLEYRKQKNNFIALTALLGRKEPIERIACFDISHTNGKETVAACVVFNVFGKEKSSYRLFNINNIQPGDDYSALEVAITKYIDRISQNIDLKPNLLIVDGGKGQLGVAEKILESFHLTELSTKNHISLLAIAKGKERIKGAEKFYLTAKGGELSLLPNSPVFKLLQNIRDATHNFAIISHRRKRDKVIKT